MVIMKTSWCNVCYDYVYDCQHTRSRARSQWSWEPVSFDTNSLDQLFADDLVFSKSTSSTNPVAVQLNHFSCSGLALAVSLSHTIGDGCTLGSFLSYWASVARYGSTAHKKRAGISAKKEAPVNFLTDPLEGRSTLRPADILVFGWEGRKHACVDLTGVSPFVGLRDHGFVAGQAITKAEADKVAKHEKACIENQHVFVPFAFDTFGALAPDAVRFLKRVQQVISSNTAHVKGQNFVFSRVGFAIQKRVAA
ncbi:putative deacetylvindoline O-acetyltransferase [Helianthus anomalus]